MTSAMLAVQTGVDPVCRRLAASHPLSEPETEIVGRLYKDSQRFHAGAEILPEGRQGAEPVFVTRGWAACVRMLSDGRRQILRLIVPGDIVGLEAGRGPPAWAVTALTDVRAVPAAPVVGAAAEPTGQRLARALALGVRQEERQFLDQIVRLGAMSAPERVANLMLELRDRLKVVGLGSGEQFPCPLTQEMLADALGLSAVHVNRVLKELRRLELLSMRSGMALLPNPQALARLGRGEAGRG